MTNPQQDVLLCGESAYPFGCERTILPGCEMPQRILGELVPLTATGNCVTIGPE